MSEDNIENLPSIEDYKDNSDELPSVEDLITEEELPSVEAFVEKEEEEVKEENIQILDDAEGNATIEVTDVIQAPQWGELVRMVNDVRESIPDIPEIKSYDNELKELSEHLEQLKESIPEVPEVKYYDAEVETICEQIDLVREEVKNLPEVKYYDEQLNTIEEKIQNLPEPKYYDGEIEAICEAIDAVRDQIPTFPKWVNEVNEVPDFSWIGKTFSVIDDDFVKVGDHLKDLKTKFDSDLESLTENLDLKDFELKEAAIKIWAHHDEFKDDDRKLKKSILSKLNETKQNIEKQISELDNKSYESDKNLKGYFEGLKEEIANLPEPKYYDDNISELKKNLHSLDTKYTNSKTNIAELYRLVEELKGQQQDLTEIYNNRPLTPDPSLKQGDDPLTPTDQKFATLQDLAANYRLFVNRVEQQLYTVGGGGAVRLDTLDDVGISTYAGTSQGIKEGNLLIYDENLKLVGIASTSLGGGSSTATGISTTWRTTSVGIHTLKNVGIGTTARSEYGLFVQGDVKATGFLSATNGYFSGILTAHTFEHHTVTDIQSTGIITGMSDLDIRRNANIVGILTANKLVGDGSGITNLGTEIEETTATSSGITTTFSVSGGYTAGYIEVYLNGVKQRGSGVDFTATDGSTVVLAEPAQDGDVLEFVNYKTLVIANGITTATNVTVTDESLDTTCFPLFVTDATGDLPPKSGSNLTFNSSTGALTATSFAGDGSGLTGVAAGKFTSNTTGIHTLSNVGIGTTTASSAITVSGDASITGVTTTTRLVATGATVGSGVTINNTGIDAGIGAGIITAANFVGGGANITALSGSNIASGTVAAARVATLNQDTTGNAATATALETARAIGGVSFDGTAAINLPGVNEAGTQNTSGTAAGLSGSPSVELTNIVGAAASIVGVVTATRLVATGATIGSGVTINNTGIDLGIGGIGVVTTGNITGAAATITSALVGSGVTINNTGIDVGIGVGIITAKSFVGDVTGNADTAGGLSGSPSIEVTNIVGAAASIAGILTATQIADGNGSVGAASSVLSSTGSGLSWVAQSGGGGGGGTPGGSDTQIQYNNSSSFGGVSNLTFSGSVLTFSGMNKEEINIVANKLSAATDINLSDGHIHMFTTNETADATPNLRYDGSTTLASKMAVGDIVTLTIMAAVNSQAYTYDSFNIDGSGITELWLGGNPPQGGGGGYDVYTYTIIKTAASPTYSVLVNVVNFQS